VIYNYTSFAAKHIFPNDKAAQAITAAGGQVKKAGADFSITHQKTITVDGATSLIMTFNLSATYFTTSRDFGYVTSDPAQVGEIERVFQADWDGSPITPSESTLVWSPVNSRSKVLDVINGARKTLLVDNEETGDKQCMSALIAAAQRGVAVRFLTAVLSGYTAGNTADGGSNYTNSGGTDANAAERAVLNAAGVQAKGATNHYMHAKMLLADYGSSTAQGFIGSENFSSTSLDKNRELGVLLNDGATLTKLDQVFEEDWSANK
jgi:phosphatidylserine/phosphatidylglycerophosphate/cardiolipin synthase-like enzyme